MRISRLELLRYGRFTDAVLDFAVRSPDMHIVFGANEAGKSTVLSAIEDLLFGIPPTSSLNFVHQYGRMRIGASLQKNGEILQLRRRKGNKDTLLTPDEDVIASGDAALAPFLVGTDRTFFARMFSLDHERLRQGGREILEAQDEVGQMLFSAGAGIVGLRDRLKALDNEADALWASRRASHRKYYQAEDRLKAADSALRQHTVSASKWQELRRAYETARQKFDALEQEIEGKSAELRKLSRIRRVYRDVRRHSELNADIAVLGAVIPLSEDAFQTLEAAEQEGANATARLETLTEQVEKDRAQRAELMYDEALLLRAEDIKQLQERRIQVLAEKADLPKRRAELAGAEAQLRRLAEELEWDASDIDRLVAAIPARAKVAAIRALLNRRSGLLSAVDSRTAALEEAETELAEIRQKLDLVGAPVDLSKLAATVSATRATGDIAARINNTEDEAKIAQAAVERSLKSLRPPIADEQTLASIAVPPSEAVHLHRDKSRDLDERKRTCGERIRSAEQELARHRKAYERITRSEDAVAPQEVSRVREHRNAGWSLVRRRYVEGVSVAEEEIRAFTGADRDLVGTYESAVSETDILTDRRFDKAEAAARLAVTSRQIAEQEELLDGLREGAKALEEESQVMDAAWQEMWQVAPFDPLPPDAMLQWMAARAEALDGATRRTAAERRVRAR